MLKLWADFHHSDMSAFALSAAIATLCFAAPAKAAKFDGNWNMVPVTTNGHCGIVRMGMAVNGGHISATSGKFVQHKIVAQIRHAILLRA